MTEPRTIDATFCDDIRHEVGGKVSLIGCYSGVMYVPDFPATLPKLAIFIKIKTPTDFPFDGVISVLVKKGPEVIYRTDIDGAAMMAAADANPSSDPDAKNVMAVSGFEFSPFPVDEQCNLDVYLETAQGTYKGGRLRILNAP